MGCCGDSKVEDEDDEEELTGPMDNRSCTDIIFLIFFAAFIIGMVVLFSIGIGRGDPYRVLYGYDVKGDVCGQENNPIEHVQGSGQNLVDKPYLYFDVPRTVKLLADDSLSSADVQSSLTDVLSNVPGGGSIPSFTGSNKRQYCLDGQGSALAALKKAPGGVVVLGRREGDVTPLFADATPDHVVGLIQDQLAKDTPAYQTDVSQLASECLVENGSDCNLMQAEGRKLPGIPISARLLKNSSAVMVMLEANGTMRVWRTAKLGTENAEAVSNQLLNYDPVTTALTGGGMCRYCLPDCPTGFKKFLFRCIPSVAENAASGIFAGSGPKSFAEDVVSDMRLCIYEILAMCAIALGLSIVMTILFRFLAGVIVYVIIGIVLVACIGGTVALWIIWFIKRGEFQELSDLASHVGVSSQVDNATSIAKNFLGGTAKAKSEEEVTQFLVGAIIATIVTVIVILVLLVLRKRIALVVQLFKEAGKAVHAMPLLILQPLVTFLALFIIGSFWCYGTLWIESAGTAACKHKSCQDNHEFVTYEKDSFFMWMRWYHIFGLLWLTQFCIACQHLVIAGSISGWYFSPDKSSVGIGTIGKAIYRLIRYHLGTAAFGSFIIALIQLIRIIMKYMESRIEKLKSAGCPGPLVSVLKLVLKCAQCCMWCFEKCIKFLNINAYIETAIYGYNFCRAAQKAFALLAANCLRVAAINSVGSFVLMLGKLAVVVATIFIGIEVLKNKTDYVMINHPWVPILLAAVFAYMTANCFISVYQMAIDTIFLCFCEDTERNDGISRPYYMSMGLMEFVENSKKAVEAAEERNRQKKMKSESKQNLVTDVIPMSPSEQNLPSVAE